MITQRLEISEAVKVYRRNELQIVSIVERSENCRLPREYLLYGEPIDRFSHALAALRFACNEINRRKYTGTVLPRVIVSIDNVDGLLLRDGSGEIADLLDRIANDGEAGGYELIA